MYPCTSCVDQPTGTSLFVIQACLLHANVSIPTVTRSCVQSNGFVIALFGVTIALMFVQDQSSAGLPWLARPLVSLLWLHQQMLLFVL